MKFVYTSCEPPKRFLTHHGIKGQQWGVRNGPPYPINPQDRSNSEKKAHGQKTSSTNADKRSFDKKKAAKIGAAAVGSALLIAGGIYLAKSGKLDNLVKLGHNSTKTAMNAMGNFVDATSDKKTSSTLSFSAKDINPSDSDYNCMDVSEATLKRHFGIDKTAKAGSRTVVGTLSDFIKQRNYNSEGVISLGGDGGGVSVASTGGETRQRVENRIKKKCKDGDVGMLCIRYNPEKLNISDSMKKYYKDHPEEAPGHAFCFGLFDGTVEFTDNQHEVSQSLIQKFFDSADPTSAMEVFQITEEAFSNQRK